MAATSMEEDLLPVPQELTQEETITQTDEIKATNDGELREARHDGPTVGDGSTTAPVSGTSPSRLVALTQKIVNLVASPLRQTNAGTSINTTTVQHPEMEVALASGSLEPHALIDILSFSFPPSRLGG